MGYYARFPHGLPTNRIPIGVWFEAVITQRDVDLDKDVDINLYDVVTANSDMSLIRRNGMRAIVQSSERTRFNGIGSETAAWELRDEIDMACGPPGCDGYSFLNTTLAGLPDDGRARYNNYGKGVMFWESDADAARFVNQFQQLVSTTSPGSPTPVSAAHRGRPPAQ